MTPAGGIPVSPTRVEKRESSPCPYCGSTMTEGECPSCGRICPNCGTPSKELSCPQCGFGSFPSGYSPTGSPAPAQSPEFSDVQQILGRTPSRREFNMVRGMVDKDKERIHRLTELLCQKFAAPLSMELIEFRALHVRRGASKNGAYLTNGECVIFAFLEATRHAGMLDRALKALAEAQLLDANLRLGLSNVKLPSLRFVVELFGDYDSVPLLLVDGEPRRCKTSLLEKNGQRKTYAIHWSPLLSECVATSFGSVRKSVSAVVESSAGTFPLRISWKDEAGAGFECIEVTLDPRRLFYGFSKRKEVEVDIGIPVPESAATDTELMLRAIGRRLDRLDATKVLFRETLGATPSGCIWMRAHEILSEPKNSQVSVSTRKKASAALVAADMSHFASLDALAKAKARTTLRRVPIRQGDDAYAGTKGLLVPSEFSTISQTDWKDTLNLALLFQGGASGR